MSDQAIPDDIIFAAKSVLTGRRLAFDNESGYGALVLGIARAILAERNRVHKQLKGEGTA